MKPLDNERLTDAELCRFLDRLFPMGIGGEDVLSELAPDGWERSPFAACFHPSVEVTELVGMCLWDVFSDNHDVITADGRMADMGSFRGASAFLDEYLSGDRGRIREGDHLRFYMGTFAVAARADLMPVYSVIFSRLRAAGARWVYHFPELQLVEFGAPDDADESPAKAAPNAAIVAERQAEVARLRAYIAEGNDRARQAAMDAPPPAIVRAHRAVYGSDPPGWPPA